MKYFFNSSSPTISNSPSLPLRESSTYDFPFSNDLNLLLTHLSPSQEFYSPTNGALSLTNNSLDSARQASNALQYSIPDTKLFYPEPFLASPSYMHSDITFLHILQYWYWLWFLFIFLICFFFLTFLSTLRWCNMRVKPRRETRGVSRSKCGDLITACVPVTWAISIIVYESADATDLNDGFGTGELVIGIRAYQWGWEYYYPRSIDLNYNVRPSYSTFIGNSLKYNYSSGHNLETNNLWKLYQGKSDDKIVLPANLLLLPLDNMNSLNLNTFSNLGSDLLKGQEAFSKPRLATKSNSINLFQGNPSLNQGTAVYENLHQDTTHFSNSMNYGLTRQHNLLTGLNTNVNTMLDKGAADKLANDTLAQPFFTKKSNTLDSNTNYFDREEAIVVPESNNLPYHTQLPLKLNLGAVSWLRGESKSLEKTSQLLKKPVDAQNFVPSSDDGKILLTEQSPRFYTGLKPNKPHLNFSEDTSLTTSNLKKQIQMSSSPTILSNYSLGGGDAVDNLLTYKALSSSYSYYGNTPSVKSGSPHANTYDLLPKNKTVFYKKWSTSKPNTWETRFIGSKTPVVNLLAGPREKAPSSLNNAYWSALWQSTNQTLRAFPILQTNRGLNNLYLPFLTPYSEYDFANYQALLKLEEGLWEFVFPTYNFYDYLPLNKLTGPFSTEQNNLFFLKKYSNTQSSQTRQNLPTPSLSKSKMELDLTVNYSNAPQANYFFPPTLYFQTENFSNLATSFDTNEGDESLQNYKNNIALNMVKGGYASGSSLSGLFPSSYLPIFNNFRGGFSTPYWQTIFNSQSDNSSSRHTTILTFDRLSNTPVLQSSAKNLLVNQAAFQKVFRARFDEGRANINSSHFANIGLKQQFLTDFGTPYTKILRKNFDFFYNPAFYHRSLYNSGGDLFFLTNSLINNFFDFPFLLSQTSDLIRHMWIDWFAQWKYKEVQPSSSSRFSTLGVPYLRDPYSFNTSQGDKYQDTEAYLTRISRSRRNFLPNWLYSSYFYNRFYVWNGITKSSVNYLTTTGNASLQKELFSDSSWYWENFFYKDTRQATPVYSFSGDNVYSRSAFRPQHSLQAFYSSMNRLVDILSRREFLYRNYFFSVRNSTLLPQQLTANPSNPLVADVRAGFLYSDPTSYSKDYNRELVYTNLSYAKFLYLNNILKSFSEVNLKFLTNIFSVNFLALPRFFTTNQLGHNADLFKNPNRPLRKGVSSLLRMHATGAIALPVEIRLQILASSRDVIHSWSVPSAGVKIDCVPGYTSHKIMVFMLTGIYWGQCQEICGRYHHWMPIVAYFMKRDLFFLWCTHFVFSSGEGNDLSNSDRHFADSLKLVSYDKSAWLSEIGDSL